MGYFLKSRNGKLTNQPNFAYYPKLILHNRSYAIAYNGPRGSITLLPNYQEMKKARVCPPSKPNIVWVHPKRYPRLFLGPLETGLD